MKSHGMIVTIKNFPDRELKVKYLGVTLDSNLTRKNHIGELCLKMSKTVGIFSNLRYYVGFDILCIL